jgi:hypothetical protein
MQLVLENLTENLQANPQLLTLTKYASRVHSVAIVGFGSGLSTLATMAAKPERIDIYDHILYDVSEYQELAASENIALAFHHKQVIDAGITECDMLVLDSFAEGNYVFTACSKLHDQVHRYMLINNTFKHAHTADPNVQLGGGQPVGIIFGINNFIQQNDPWHIAENYYWEPGVTVLYKRRNLTDYGR